MLGIYVAGKPVPLLAIGGERAEPHHKDACARRVVLTVAAGEEHASLRPHFFRPDEADATVERVAEKAGL